MDNMSPPVKPSNIIMDLPSGPMGKISPNPTRGLLNIKYVNERNEFVRIYLANSNGVVLDEFISSENEMNIDISNYPSGIYYVYFSSEEHCSSAEQQISRKLILNK